MIQSFAKLRMDKLLALDEGTPHQAAGQVWLNCNRNILEFAQQFGSQRYCRVLYEDLVRQPEQEVPRLCEFLGIPFDPALLNPYEGERMTEGVHDVSASIGDPNFANHRAINPSLADAWRTIQLPHILSPETQAIAREFGYELPHEDQAGSAGANDGNVGITDWEEIEL
ncbi:MAG: sulfotransferase [Synechococcaceae cyanobacterium RL_1_2]|nr:sulfotransferase [Synechococcaceae cyanobacterium RL_1_2]